MRNTAILIIAAILAFAPTAAFCGPKSGPLKDNPKLSFKSPADPPFLNWPVQPDAKTYRLEMSRDKAFPASNTLRANTGRNFFTPEKSLGSGKWYYRIRPNNGEWSSTYTVDIAEDATRFIIPKRKNYVQGHPRLYISSGDIPILRRDALGTKKDLWLKIKQKADGLIGKPLVEEPPRFTRNPDGSLDIVSWRKLSNAGGKVSDDLITLSFAYLISKDKKYLAESERILDHVCAWQVPGSTADPSHIDHPARDILHGMCITYDWLYSDLTDQERERVRSVIIARADKLYEHENPFLMLGVNNHPWLRMAALADAGCVLLGDYSIAQDWLDFTEQIYAGRFFCLGGKNGEWHEGISYWAYALLYALEFADVVKSTTGVDFFTHPWLKQCPYFPIYAHSPWSSGLPYGDVHPAPMAMTTVLAQMRFAKALRNPYAKWYVSQPYTGNQFYVQRFLADDPTLAAKAPSDLPQSILFEKPGWAVFHTSLDSPDDVFFTLKSGQFFSSGHEHPDQNSFSIEAFGKRLIIDSGYYDWYGSPHHYKWVMMTKAHNVIMVDGKGQAGPREEPDPNASGHIGAFFRSPQVNYVIGEIIDPAVYHGTVTRFLRMAAFLTPDVIVMNDVVDLPKPSQVDWLLHTTAMPEMSRGNTSFDMTYDGVGLRFDMLSPMNVDFSSKIGYEPTPPQKDNPQDAHLTFTVQGKTSKVQFLTVYQPRKLSSNTSPKKVSRIDGINAVAAQVGPDQVMFWDGSLAKKMKAGRMETDGFMASVGDGKWSLCCGRSLTIDGKQVISANQPVSISRAESALYIVSEKPCSLKIYPGKRPGAVLPKGWTYDNESGTLSGRMGAGEITLKI